MTAGADGTANSESLEGRASGPGLVRRDVVDAAATELAIHVAIVANALDPALIVLGGGLGCAPGRYWATFRAALPRYAWGPYSHRLRVRRAGLGTKSGMIGAALSALEADKCPRSSA